MVVKSKPTWSFANEVTMTADMSRGQWVKRIKGKLRSFGTLDDPQTALKRWRVEGPQYEQGLIPLRYDPHGVMLVEVCGLFLQTKKPQVAHVTYANYEQTVKKLVIFFGKRRQVSTIKPADFERLLLYISDCYGPTRRGAFVIWTKSIFSWAFDTEVIENQVRFGKGFRSTSIRERRKRKRRTGKQLFDAPTILRTLAIAPPIPRAMVLLGINGGMGNMDVAMLPRNCVEVATTLIDFPRPKTEVERQITLWPETVEAILMARKVRPKPRSHDGDGLVFLNRAGGPWYDRNGKAGAVTKMFNRLYRKAHPEAPLEAESGFYTLRRTFRTVADEVCDQHAAFRIMGQVVPGMAGVYVQEIGIDRLRKVTDHVREWLFK